MMWMTTMNPETRRLIKVNPEEAHATARMFDLLLGKRFGGPKGIYHRKWLSLFGRGGRFLIGKIAVENGWKPQAASLKCGYEAQIRKR